MRGRGAPVRTCLEQVGAATNVVTERCVDARRQTEAIHILEVQHGSRGVEDRWGGRTRLSLDEAERPTGRRWKKPGQVLHLIETAALRWTTRVWARRYLQAWRRHRVSDEGEGIDESLAPDI